METGMNEVLVTPTAKGAEMAASLESRYSKRGMLTVLAVHEQFSPTPGRDDVAPTIADQCLLHIAAGYPKVLVPEASSSNIAAHLVHPLQLPKAVIEECIDELIVHGYLDAVPVSDEQVIKFLSETFTALSNEVALHIMYLSQRGANSVADIASKISAPPISVYFQAKKLLESSLIEREKVRVYRFTVSSLMLHVLLRRFARIYMNP